MAWYGKYHGFNVASSHVGPHCFICNATSQDHMGAAKRVHEMVGNNASKGVDARCPIEVLSDAIDLISASMTALPMGPVSDTAGYSAQLSPPLDLTH